MFFGGGTPSLLDAAQLARILDAIPRAPGAEVTVECNPDSVDAREARRLRGRGRQPAVVRRAVDAARTCSRRSAAPTIPANVARAVDVGARRRASSASTSTSSTARRASRSTTGAPRSTPRSRSSPTHVSAYALTVEPGTPLGRAVAAGERPAPDDDDQADEVRDRRRRASRAAGFEWYEVSNWARPGRGVPPQPPLLGAGRLPGDRLRRARPHRDADGAAAGGTCARPSATSPRSRPGDSTEAGAETLDAAARAAEAAHARAAHPAAGSSSRGRGADALAEWTRASTTSASAGRSLDTARRPCGSLTRRGRLLAATTSPRACLGSPRAAGRAARWHSVESSANGRSTSARRRSSGRSSRSTSQTAQPVGSQTIARSPGLGVSSATVRNEMTVLEREGYIVQPHTSAGRIPTDRGYRYFVDHFTRPGRAARAAAARGRPTSSAFTSAHQALEDLLHETSQLLARVSTHAAVVVGPQPTPADGAQRAARAAPARRWCSRSRSCRTARSRRTCSHLADDVDDDRPSPPRAPRSTRSSPGARWPTLPDAACPPATPRSTRSPRDARDALAGARRAASRRAALRRRREPARGRAGGVRHADERGPAARAARAAGRGGRRSSASCSTRASPCASAPRTPLDELRDCSIVLAPYHVDGEVAGTVGVLGPTRMDYRQAHAAVAAVSQQLGRLLLVSRRR